MPVVTIRLIEGRTLEQKRELTKVICEAVSRIANTPLDGPRDLREHAAGGLGARRSAVCRPRPALRIRGKQSGDAGAAEA